MTNENLTFDEMLDQLMEEETDDMGMGSSSNSAYTSADTEQEIALEGDDEEDDLDLDDLEDDEEDDDDEDDEDDDEEDDDMEDMDDDLSDLSDEDLRRLEKDLKDGDCEGCDEPEVRLTPDEEIQADDMMQIAGAASLIRSEMNAEERAELLESTEDIRIGMVEGFLTESMLVDIADSVNPADMNAEPMTEAKMYNKTTVKMSKQARLAQLFAIAVNTSARAHNDPDYARYKKACKIKRAYSQKLRTKYKSEATKRMRVLFARLKSSKSPILKGLGKKVEK